MECIIKYLGSGKIYKYPSTSAVSLTIVNFSDITYTIIPFFEKHPVVGSKLINFNKFKEAANIIKTKEHLVPESKGFKKLFELKKTINNLNYKNLKLDDEYKQRY